MASLETMVGEYPIVFTMDNAPVQSSMPETYPTLQFKYLPPYSPFLNPIENTFSVFKNYTEQHLHAVAGAPTPSGVTQRVHKERTRTKSVQVALPCITREKVQAEYVHANNYLVRCIERTDINN